jgi:hypothetical protein
VADTIVATNGPGRDCAGPGSVTSLGANVQSDGSCPFNDATDFTGDPGFDPRALGPPRWYPLLPSSPAVDDPTRVLCLPGVLTDIIKTDRPQGTDRNGDGFVDCDSGSFELVPGAISMLSISNARIREGQRARKKIRFTVSLSASPEHTVTVRAATRDGTARAGFDYVAKRVTLVFKPHQRHKTFTVAVIGDRNHEKNETFAVDLSTLQGARTADAGATATIVNDD